MSQVGCGEMVEENGSFPPILSDKIEPLDGRGEMEGPRVGRDVSFDEFEMYGFPPRVEMTPPKFCVSDDHLLFFTNFDRDPCEGWIRRIFVCDGQGTLWALFLPLFPGSSPALQFWNIPGVSCFEN